MDSFVVMQQRAEKKITLAMTGGGTGGHITPIVSLLEYGDKHMNLREKCNHIYRFGESNSYEQEACSQIGWSVLSFVPVAAGKMRRYRTLSSVLLNLRDALRVIVGFLQALLLLKHKNVDILFCKGGYVALPVSFAAKCLGIPVHVHESDTYAGLTNRLVAKFATYVYTGFPGTLDREIVVGQILSPKFVEPSAATLSLRDEEITNVLVICGSQGSSIVLQALLDVLDRKGHIVKSMNRFVILGKRNDTFKEKFSKFKGIQIFDFLSPSDLSVLYRESDLAITRGSATTLAELQHFGVKKVIIPLPYTGGNHQEYNADWYVKIHGDTKVVQDGTMIEQLERALVESVGVKKKGGEVSKDNYFYPHRTILTNFFY